MSPHGGSAQPRMTEKGNNADESYRIHSIYFHFPKALTKFTFQKRFLYLRPLALKWYLF